MSQATVDGRSANASRLRDAAWAVAAHGAAAALAVLGAVWSLRLWRADLTVPFCYEGDAVQSLAWVKGVLDNPWYLHNPYVGMPSGQEMHDFPSVCVDSFQFLVMKLIGLVFPNYAVVGNLYFLATFPLSALSALFVLRRLGVSYFPALACSMLFAFLPYHFMRGQAHLFLASYYMVPLAVLVSLWLYLEPESFVRPARLVPAVLIGLVVSSTGIYYAYFTCFFFLVAGLVAFFRTQRALATVPALGLTAVVCAGVVANLLPALLYRKEHGPNPEAVVRHWEEAEYYGLKVSQLLLPVPGHRVPAMAELNARYHKPGAFPLCNNENIYSALGLAGAAGFLFLVGRLVWLLSSRSAPSALDGLSILNLFAVLLGTMGSFGALLSLLGCTWIRAYNRLSVFIGFFALAALAMLLAGLSRRLPQSLLARGGLLAGLALLLAGGLLDQTTAGFIPPHARLKEMYATEGAFVRSIEADVPAGAMIFQLPYVPFVEHGPPHKMLHYDHCRAYLHSRTLRWSYGTMKGRPGDQWQRWATSLPPAEFLEVLVLAGFAGVTVDRHGYADSGADLEAKLVAAIGTRLVESADGRHAFYNLAGYAGKVRQKYPPAELEAREQEARHPIQITWQGSFSAQEGTAPAEWRWCGREGALTLVNPDSEPREYELKMACHYWSPDSTRLTLGGLLGETLTIGPEPTAVRRKVTVPPGTHQVTFRCDGQRIPAPNDPRELVFRVMGFSMRRADWTVQARAR